MSELQHPINLDFLTPEKAIQATIDMWSDMQEALGYDPNALERCVFKKMWCEEHSYNSFNTPEHDCFLCEYAKNAFLRSKGFVMERCDLCPIIWPEHEFVPNLFDPDEMIYVSVTMPKCQNHRVDYLKAPLSDILDYLKDFNNWNNMKCYVGGEIDE